MDTHRGIFGGVGCRAGRNSCVPRSPLGAGGQGADGRSARAAWCSDQPDPSWGLRNDPVPLSAGAGRQNAGVADTAPEAVALLAAALPEDCGPAVEGTADGL
ncbi:DUF6193 family natural product biosynthesis protein [Streptomyces rubiginosohelvolus]